MSNLFDVNKLIAWLHQQPPEGEYQWSDPVFCLMGRYITDVGTAADLYAYGEMPHYHEIAETKPWTFGAALERAEQMKGIAYDRTPPLPGGSPSSNPGYGARQSVPLGLPSPDRVRKDAARGDHR